MTNLRPSFSRSILAAGALLAAAAAPSCQFNGDRMNDHWSIESIPPRVGRTVLGYDASKESSYKDFAWDRKQSISLTFRRHVFNHNPMNPNQPNLGAHRGERPVNSLMPNPWNYIHVEGIAIGLLSGTFIPLPIDSIIGTLEPGGPEEFAEGFRQSVTLQPLTASDADAFYSADVRAFYGEDGEAPPFEMTENAR